MAVVLYLRHGPSLCTHLSWHDWWHQKMMDVPLVLWQSRADWLLQALQRFVVWWRCHNYYPGATGYSSGTMKQFYQCLMLRLSLQMLNLLGWLMRPKKNSVRSHPRGFGHFCCSVWAIEGTLFVAPPCPDGGIGSAPHLKCVDYCNRASSSLARGT